MGLVSILRMRLRICGRVNNSRGRLDETTYFPMKVWKVFFCKLWSGRVNLRDLIVERHDSEWLAWYRAVQSFEMVLWKEIILTRPSSKQPT